MASETEGQKINLTTDDFKNVMNIIDTACQRGAFRADEMSDVGNVYTKFKTIYYAIIQNQQQEIDNKPSAEHTEQKNENTEDKKPKE